MASHTLSSSAASGAQVQVEGAADVIAKQEIAAQHAATPQSGATVAPSGAAQPFVSFGPAAQQVDQQAIQLSTGEYVSIESFNKLSSEQQQRLWIQGVQKFNEAQVVAFEGANVKLNTGEYVSKDAFDKLSPEIQAQLMSLGVEAFNAQQTEAEQKFLAQNVKLATGEFVSKEAFDTLPQADKDFLMQHGVTEFNRTRTVTSAGVSPVPTGSPQAVPPELLARVQEIQSALDYISKLQSGEIVLEPWQLEQMGDIAAGRADLEKKLADQLAAIAAIQQGGIFTTPTGEPLTTEAFVQQVLTRTSPFVVYDASGSISKIDVRNAQKASLDIKQAFGLTEQQFGQIKSAQELEYFLTYDPKTGRMVIYSSDAIAAADAGKIDDLRNLGIDTAKVEQAKQQRTAAQQTITGSAQSLNVQVGDVGNLSQAEIANLIRAGVDVNLIVTAGNNPNTVNSAIDSIRAQITEAKATISGYKTIQDGKEVYTLSDLARFQREHPNDTTTLAFLYDSKTLDNIASFNKQVADSVNAVGVMLGGRSYGPEGMALDRALRSAGISVIPTVASSKVIVGADGFGTVMYFDASGRALSDKDILASKWDKLSDEQKQQVAAIYARDLYKGSYLGEIIGSMQDIVAETTAESGPVVGTLISLPFFPVTGLEGFAHQSALRQIQTQLKTDYASEINVLQDYRNKDGTFDVGKINEAFKANPIEAQRILQGLALPDAQSVSDRLKYFNQNWKVSLSEWIIAGATVPADILMVTGGGTLLGMGATARTSAEAAAMATRARIIGAVGTGIGATFLGVGLAEQIPNWKNMTPAERYTALGMDAVMLAGMGLGIKEIAKGNAAAKVDPKSIIDRSIDADAAKTTEQLVNRRLEPTDINIERSHQAAEVYATAKGIDTGKAYSQLLHSDGTLNLDAALKAGMDVSAFGKIAPELVEPWKQASEAWKAYANSSIDRVQLEKDLAAFRDKLPTKITVESYGALSDATAKLDATVAQARDSVDTSGSIGKAVVNAQDAVATARKLAADTRQFVTQGLPNATVNGLMNAAKGIDDATAAVRKAITDSKQFITQGLPDKAMNILMDAAKGLDDAIAQARAVIAAIKTFATDTIPDKTVNALMDAAKGLDDAVAKARELGTVTKAFVTQQVPNTAVDALMTAAKSVDDATAKMRLITQQAREYITQGLPDKAVNVLMDGAARLDDDIRKVTDLATKVRSYITTDLPDAVVNHLMDAAKGLDDSIATANRALSDAKVLLTQRIPDKAINVLMDAAQSVDDAAIKVRDSIQARVLI